MCAAPVGSSSRRTICTRITLRCTRLPRQRSRQRGRVRRRRAERRRRLTARASPASSHSWFGIERRRTPSNRRARRLRSSPGPRSQRRTSGCDRRRRAPWMRRRVRRRRVRWTRGRKMGGAHRSAGEPCACGALAVVEAEENPHALRQRAARCRGGALRIRTERRSAVASARL